MINDKIELWVSNLTVNQDISDVLSTLEMNQGINNVSYIPKFTSDEIKLQVPNMTTNQKLLMCFTHLR